MFVRCIKTLGVQQTFMKIGLKKVCLLTCQFYYTYESCILLGEVREKLDRGAIVWISLFISG